MHEMEIAMVELWDSEHYCKLRNQLQVDNLLKNEFSHRVGSEKQVQMVIYALGSLVHGFRAHYQFAQALLLRGGFSTLDKIQVDHSDAKSICDDRISDVREASELIYSENFKPNPNWKHSDDPKLIIEGSALNVITWANAFIPPPQRFREAFEEMTVMLGDINCLVYYVHEVANNKANELAKLGMALSEFSLIMCRESS
ncbi:hypothetical protein J5N97_008795 [Dioscorea zingiberensis]|uniref:Uncharacterized protein n=1 Tax=Dioscorea zingiberensis TaxID=325984 RepID=A0A9D5CV74_9LILI|nr:hypothetical protein J5N97_008795 [Dioscorea zingiberensis]